jgi:hypothetical protein
MQPTPVRNHLLQLGDDDNSYLWSAVQMTTFHIQCHSNESAARRSLDFKMQTLSHNKLYAVTGVIPRTVTDAPLFFLLGRIVDSSIMKEFPTLAEERASTQCGNTLQFQYNRQSGHSKASFPRAALAAR